VLLVVICAVAGGRGPALGAAAAGGLADNLMLREPIEWSPITSARGAVDVSLFLAVAFIVGWLVEGLRIARAHAAEGAERERRAREERNRLVATITHDLATACCPKTRSTENSHFPRNAWTQIRRSESPMIPGPW
jgi:K+-sensing histidine kinase KdpD